jgi:hypothetical protein
MSDKKAVSFEEVFAECEKDPEFRREYLRAVKDETHKLITENNALHKQLDIAVKGLNMARSEVIQYFPPHEYTLAIIDDALAEINRIGGEK